MGTFSCSDVCNLIQNLINPFIGKEAISHHAHIEWAGSNSAPSTKLIAALVDSLDNKVDANGKLTSYLLSLGPFLTLYQATAILLTFG